MRRCGIAGITGWLALLAWTGCTTADDERAHRPAAHSDAGATGTGAGAESATASMWHSGSRLRARVIDAGGGAVTFSGFRDTELDVDCTLQLAADGTRRCLPAQSLHGTVEFLDSRCSRPVFRGYSSVWQPCAAEVEPFTLQWFRSPECREEGAMVAYRIRSPLADQPLYTMGWDGVCTPLGVKTCLRALEPVAPDDFVVGRVEVEPVDHGLSIERTKFDDGASAIQGTRDAERDVACSAQPPVTTDRCLPNSQAYIFHGNDAHGAGAWYGDPICATTPLALDFAREPCTPAAIAIVWRIVECGPHEMVPYELRRQHENGYMLVEGGCEPWVPSPGEWLYELGPQLDLETLPRLRVMQAGSSRVRLQYRATPDGVPLSVDTYYDEHLALPCEVEETADDQRRCVPYEGAVNVEDEGPFLYVDCERRVVPLRAKTYGGCDVDLSSVQRVNVRGERSRWLATYAIGPALTKAPVQLYFRRPEGCHAALPDAEATYYDVGPELTLAVMEERVE